jgi:hypothetical protein
MKSFVLLLTVLSLAGCIAGKGDIKINIKKRANTSESNISNASISSVQIINHQLVITGAGLADITDVKVGGNSLNETFSIESKSATQIIANSISAFSFDVAKVFNLILSDANASATFPIDFSLCNATLNGKGFNCAITAMDKDVLSYDSVSGLWKPRAATGINYLGAFNASTNPPAPTPNPFPSSGSYYIVSADGMIGATSFVVGDWLISNGTAWQKIGNSTLVTSVFSRTGNVVAQEGDYDLDKLTDVDLSIAPTNGKVLKFNGTKWIASDDLSGGGAGSVTATEIAAGAVTDAKIAAVAASKITGTINSTQILDGTIVNADISGTAAIDYSKLNIPNTTIPYAKLNIADGDIPAAKISGIPSVTSVLTTTIADGDTTHAPDGNAVFDALGLKFNSTGGVLTVGTISGIPLPTNNDDVVNKQYVDSYGQWTKSGSDIYRASGYVGIGTSTPDRALTIVGTGGVDDDAIVYLKSDTDTNNSGLIGMARSRGAPGAETPVMSGDLISVINSRGYVGAGVYSIVSEITTKAESDFATSPSGDLRFSTKASGAAKLEKMRILGNGNVGIGTTTPKETLHVVGGLALKRTIVKDDILSGWDGINPIARASGLGSQYTGEVYTVTISSRGTNYARAKFLRNALAAGAGYLYRTSLEGNADITAVMDPSDNIVEFYSNITSAVPGDTVVHIEMVLANDSLTSEVISINPGVSMIVGGSNHTEATSNSQYFSGKLGIGTTAALSPLDIIFGNGTISNDVKARGVVSEYYGVGNHAGKGGVAMVAGGTKAAPTAVVVNNTASLAMPLFYDGSIWRVGSRIDSYVSAVTNNTSVASGLTFNVGTATGDSASGLFTGMTEAMRILSSGYVGIGTNAPQKQLHILGNAGTDFIFQVESSAANNDANFLLLADQNSGATNFSMRHGTSGGNGWNFGMNTSENFTITSRQALTNTDRLTILSTGNVGVGTTNPGYKLQVGVAADGSEARANAWNVLSDERLKRDFEIIPESLEKILSLNGYYYYWNRGTDTSKKLGLKAQEVEKVFPEVVSHGKDGFLSVSYNHLVAGVIEAVKEFFQKWQGDSKGIHREIASLKKDNELLKKDNELLKAKNLETQNRLDTLEKMILKRIK